MRREDAPLGVRSISTQIGQTYFSFFFQIINCLSLYLGWMPVLAAFSQVILLMVDNSYYHTTCAVRNRMKSVKNIQKITKAMKMVAASKLRAIQVKAENSRGLWQPFTALLGDTPSAFLSNFGHLFILDKFS